MYTCCCFDLKINAAIGMCLPKRWVLVGNVEMLWFIMIFVMICYEIIMISVLICYETLWKCFELVMNHNELQSIIEFTSCQNDYKHSNIAYKIEKKYKKESLFSISFN